MDTKHLFRQPSRRAMTLFLLAVLTATSASTALAQWQWKDASGRRVFSDTAPPPTVSEQDILKRPGQRATADPAAAEPSATVSGTPPAAASGATQPTPTTAPAASPVPKSDGALDEKKKQLEKAEADKVLAEKKAIEAKNAKIRADNCESARRSQAALDSGIRVTTNNAKGEVEFLDEAGRAAQRRKMQDVIRENCR